MPKQKYRKFWAIRVSESTYKKIKKVALKTKRAMKTIVDMKF